MIDQVRRFNRTVTQRAGALEDAFLSRGRPLGQARVLWEIGSEGRDIKELRAQLDLDSGYLSRLLRSLESDGLVVVEPNGADGRVRTARLTEHGQAERAELDRLSDEAAVALLDPLGPRQRVRLIAAMAEAERLLTASAVQVAVRDPRHPDARRALQAYVAELAGRFQGGFDPAQEHLRRPRTRCRRPRDCSCWPRCTASRSGAVRSSSTAVPRRRSSGCGSRPGPAGWGWADGCWPSSRPGPRRMVPAPSGWKPTAPWTRRSPVPDGRLPRGRGVQRRALRPPLVREGTQRLSRPPGRSKTIRSARPRTRRRS